MNFFRAICLFMEAPKVSFCMLLSSQIFRNRSILQRSLHNDDVVQYLKCNLFIQSSERSDDTQNLRRITQCALDGA